jgi:hypothetical protein
MKRSNNKHKQTKKDKEQEELQTLMQNQATMTQLFQTTLTGLTMDCIKYEAMSTKYNHIGMTIQL